MDINQWLQRTVTARDEDAQELQELEEPTTLHHRALHNEASRTLDPAGINTTDPRHAKAKGSKRKHKRKASSSIYSRSSGSASTHSDSVSQSSSSSSSSAPSEHFERRKRHKTRENLYEPHSGERKRRSKKKGKDEDKEKKGNKKHRRTEKKRREAKKPGQNLINNFSADNVRHDRLTLQPGASVGLFKKGRASSPTKRRGLPDLVFSEMRFLQKPREQPEASLQQDHSKEPKKRKKRRDVENAEVSAFFSEKRPPLGVKVENRWGTANTIVTHSSKPRSRDNPIQSTGTARSDNQERHNSRARSYSTKTVVPDDSITYVNVEPSRVFNGSKIMLAGQFEQSSESRPAERSKPAEPSSKSQQQSFPRDERTGSTKTKDITVNSVQHAEHKYDQEAAFEPGHSGNKNNINTEKTINISKLSMPIRPLSSPVGKLLIACENAVEQERKTPAKYQLPHQHTTQYPLSNTFQCLEQVSSIMYPISRRPHPRYTDQVMEDYAPSDSLHQYQHNLPIQTYSAQQYDPNDQICIEYEQHPYGQQRAPSRVHRDNYRSQREQEDALNLQTWTEDNHHLVEQRRYAPSNHVQRQASPHDDQSRYQAHARYHNQYYDPDPRTIHYSDYPGRNYMVLPHSTNDNSASIPGYRIDGPEQQFIAGGNEYRHSLQEQEGTGIEDELDYELYGGQDQRTEEVIGPGNYEPSVVPESFWRPRRLY